MPFPMSADRLAVYAPFQAILDAQPALERLDGDERLYLSLLQHLLESNVTAPESIVVALHQNAPQQALAVAHALCGAAGHIGLIDVHRITQDIVRSLRRNSTVDLDALYDLENALHDAETLTLALASILPPPPPPPPLPPLPDGAESVQKLLRALDDRDFASVDLYTHCRPFLAITYPEILPRLDLDMDLLNFKDAATLLAARTGKP